MSYDKDWEVHLALNDPNDPIHDYIAEALKNEDQADQRAPVDEAPAEACCFDSVFGDVRRRGDGPDRAAS